jgi:hypothetical protein
MSLQNLVLHTGFTNQIFYTILNKVLMLIQNKISKELNQDVDIESILTAHNLSFVETRFFREKTNVIRVKDNSSGKNLILKIGRIDPFQLELFLLAKKMEDKLSFKVPAIFFSGDGYIVMEEIRGQFLNNFYENDIEWCVSLSKTVADSYQVLIDEFIKSNSLGDLQKVAEKWFLSRLNMWSKPIIEQGLISFQFTQDLADQFQYYSNRENFFSWVHGNTIGDHIIISDNQVYLIDLSAEPRAGGQYYDFLRSIDFMILKSSKHNLIFTNLPRWINQYLSEFNEEEIKFILTFRAIGALGWDILHHKVEYTNGNIEEKKARLLNIIKGEY